MFKVSAKTHRIVVIVISVLTAATAYLATNGDLWGLDPTMTASIGGAVNLAVTLLRHVTDTPAT